MERITHKFMMELPAGMFDELKVLSHQNHQSVESYIKQFVRLRSFIDKTIVMRHSLDLSVEVAVDGKPILSPELSILRFVGQSGIRNSVAFSDREFAFLKTKSNMSLYVRESIAFGLEMLEKSGEKSGARFSVGDGNFIFLA